MFQSPNVMECVQNVRQKHLNLMLLLKSNILKYVKSISNTYDEEQRKLRHNEELAKKIAETEAQVVMIAAEQAKAQEEKTRVLQKNIELKAKLKRETIKAQELQSVVDTELARIDEQQQLSKNIHDKANLLLKPYHEILGVTFQLSKEPEVSLRFLFDMPNGKKCVVKLTKNGLKVIKCVPMLKDLDLLEAHLAKTNDFPGFVVQLRTRFLKEVILSNPT